MSVIIINNKSFKINDVFKICGHKYKEYIILSKNICKDLQTNEKINIEHFNNKQIEKIGEQLSFT